MSGTDAMCLFASELPGVDEGTACTQSSFKVGGKAFLFVGMQAGRHKVMLKLGDSLEAAEAVAAEHPDECGVGKTKWVTLRFDEKPPVTKRVWAKWIKESFGVMQPKPKQGKG